MTEAERAYLAGLLDGEGSIGGYLSERSNRPSSSRAAGLHLQVTITNSDIRMIEWLRLHFKGSTQARNPSPGNYTVYSWRVGKREGKKVLQAALPYLVTKREQADAWLQLCELTSVTYRGVGVPSDNGAERERLVQLLADLKTPTQLVGLVRVSGKTAFHLPGEVDRVIDGDSLVAHVKFLPGQELHGIHVRLQGINAPELRHEGGPAARDFLRSLLPEGAGITLVSSQEDKYGRLLARVLLDDGSDASSLMLSSGNAVPMA